MKYFAPSKRGFSLIEIMVSLFVVTVALVLYESSLGTIVLTRTSSHQNIALQVATREMEELRATPYISLPGSGSFADASLGTLPSATTSITMTDFNSKTKQAVVTVSWQEPNTAASSTVSLTTLITKVGGLP